LKDPHIRQCLGIKDSTLGDIKTLCGLLEGSLDVSDEWFKLAKKIEGNGEIADALQQSVQKEKERRQKRKELRRVQQPVESVEPVAEAAPLGPINQELADALAKIPGSVQRFFPKLTDPIPQALLAAHAALVKGL